MRQLHLSNVAGSPIPSRSPPTSQEPTLADPAPPDLLTLTAQIVAAHVTGNEVATDDVPALINVVYGALARVEAPVVAEQHQEPAVPIKRSIQHDYLVCLEDGAKVKMLKRYLQRFGLTPETYRIKWGLPKDYPMVAPAYSTRRSALARHFGLGTALRTAERSAPEAQHLPVEVEGPTVLASKAQHTAASVFANFPDADAPAEAETAANDAGKPGRKRFSQQPMRAGRKN